ncbi:tetratricopeptide repeat protein [Planctomicrobium piriforme]|uniref:Uncharacterized protein n=1 Tax=Planctomicrobium piriforme TaxID=1576369 RepID=A0A1I3B0D4_9PLAN|nr:hypothetical protein [Planctomicrobium piriforme]SFH55536.1 hypothetical protein SAMN05421753_101144 [Planctomicrobium piriforme]
MNFLRWMFGFNNRDASPRVDAPQKSQIDLANDPNMIKVYDEFGREMFITRQQWRDNVLLGDLEKKRDDPDHLYGMIAGALEDGFASDVIPYAEHLHRIDSNSPRSATILGVVYMENNRLDDAERILSDFLSKHGDDGFVLTNLAKVYSRRGDDTRAESTLWNGLQVDPNQGNGFDWYTAIQREHGGEDGALAAYCRIAKISGSWRAQLLLARDAIQRKDLATAESLYGEALAQAGTPVPPDLLMQMSGDLGRNGHLEEMIRFVEPRFDPAIHGLWVGNNLIKANRELGRTRSALHVLEQLYAQKRPDWQETLSYWDTELAKANVAQRAKIPPGELSICNMLIEGPLWTRDGSPFVAVLPVKSHPVASIVFQGSTVLRARPRDEPAIQLSDAPGRMSRAIPLALAERIHLHTNAIGLAMIPWVQNQGFAVFERSLTDNDTQVAPADNVEHPDFIVAVSVDCTQPKWILLLKLIRTSDGEHIAETQLEADPENPGPAVEQLCRKVEQLLVEHAGVRTPRPPEWYRVPTGLDFSDYLLRLEQQLAATCMNLEFLHGGGLSGEHEILDGALQLCVREPGNHLVRMLFAQTLRQMKKARPAILAEYTKKVDLLQKDHALDGDIGKLIGATISNVMTEYSTSA